MSKDIVWSKYVSSVTKFFDKIKNKKGFFLQSGNGLMFEDEAPDKKFNLYEGDCNFLITEKDYIRMASVPGVEVILPVTPYKVRVGIAKLFNDKEVLKNIDEKIDPFKGIHQKIIYEYSDIAKLKYDDYVVYEDMWSMVHIDSKANMNNIDNAFLICSGKAV